MLKLLFASIILAITRLSATSAMPGNIDPGFNVTLDNDVSDVKLQADHKIVVCGAFTNVNGKLSRGIVRLNSDGSTDTSFHPMLNADGWSSVILPDGRIIVNGRFTQINGVQKTNLARLNPDGSLDDSFTAKPFPLSSLLALQDDGKIIFGVYDDVVRLNQDGSDDVGFVVTLSQFAVIGAVTVQRDGKILIGGDFTSVNGFPLESVGRLNPDGSVDTTFRTAGQDLGDENVVLVQQPDGSVLMGGDVTAKLNPDGRLSSEFAIRHSGVPEVYSIVLDGTNIVMGGQFPGFFVVRTNLARLMQNGRVDPGYDPAAGANKVVYSLALQDDGRLLVGGRFTIFAGQRRSYLVRLLGDQPTLETHVGDTDHLILSWPSRFSNWVLQTAQDVSSTNWETVTNPVTLTGSQCFVTNSVGTSNRFFRLIGP